MSLNAFLNPIKPENQKIVISSRFVENDKPVEWELKAISAEQDEQLRKKCTIVKKAKNGITEREFNNELYMSKLAAMCVVYPDLLNTELQDHYHVMNGEDLLKEMLTCGEYYKLLESVRMINNFDEDFEELLEQAKN